MTEREAIKYCKGMIQRLERPAFMVQYEGAINDIMALEIAISALKKQEQKKPIEERRNAGFEYRVNVCPTCGETLSDRPKYCPECGQSLCWDGEEE